MVSDPHSPEVIYIGIGELRVSTTPLSSIGLGSCIGLVLHDCNRQRGGLAHIMLPNSNGRTDRPGKYADTAICALMEELSFKRRKNGEVIAKMVGGASMFTQLSDNISIGEKNIEKIRILLKEYSIPLSGEDVGGSVGRTMTYYPTNGGKIIIKRGDGSIGKI
jgi:chemotaxis protein CheD